jgi:hypothetical protein
MITVSSAFVAAIDGSGGLNLSVGSGVLWMNGVTAVILPQIIVMPKNNTTFVFINITTATVQTNQSGFIAGCVPIAVVVTSNAYIMSVIDERPDFYSIPASASIPNFADAEIPGGSINGSNVTFSLAHAPNPQISLSLYLNGLLQLPTSYSLSGSTITMTAAPHTGSVLEAYYRF